MTNPLGAGFCVALTVPSGESDREWSANSASPSRLDVAAVAKGLVVSKARTEKQDGHYIIVGQPVKVIRSPGKRRIPVLVLARRSRPGTPSDLIVVNRSSRTPRYPNRRRSRASRASVLRAVTLFSLFVRLAGRGGLQSPSRAARRARRTFPHPISVTRSSSIFRDAIRQHSKLGCVLGRKRNISTFRMFTPEKRPCFSPIA
jgi:hypothetical protein